MFLKSFIELLALYKNIFINASNKLANETYLARDTTENNLYKINNDISMFKLFSEFIAYYDDWYASFFIKSKL